MVGIGLLMIAIGLTSLWLRWHHRLHETRWFHAICVLASPLGLFAVTFGWITTEHGRQPWVIYGLLRTADAVAPISLPSVAASLVLFVVVYCLVFGTGTYYILRLMRTVPHTMAPPSQLAGRAPADRGQQRAARARRRPVAGAGGVTAVQYDLPLIWAGLVAFYVAMYVVMDGFDLGIGILFPFARSDTDRDLMMNSVAPIWDGNETWLVLGGTSLFAAFPIAYSVLLPAFYLPLFVMLLALIFRGVSFEFRFKSIDNRHWWDRAFAFGSMAATFAQGVVLGSFILGVQVTDRQYSGGAFSWLTPFALFCGLALMGGYAMLAAGWLIGKTTGRPAGMGLPQDAGGEPAGPGRGRHRLLVDAAHPPGGGRPLVHLAQHPLPLAGADPRPPGGRAALPALERREHWTPFFLTLALFLLSYAGLAISLFPYVIPPSITIWDAASSPSSQIFLLVGVAIITPIILTYTFWNYWVFRGKVTPDQHYH